MKLGGFTPDTFTDAHQQAFINAMSEHTGTDPDSVMIIGVFDAASALLRRSRRMLVEGTTGGGMGIDDSASGDPSRSSDGYSEASGSSDGYNEVSGSSDGDDGSGSGEASGSSDGYDDDIIATALAKETANANAGTTAMDYDYDDYILNDDDPVASPGDQGSDNGEANGEASGSSDGYIEASGSSDGYDDDIVGAALAKETANANAGTTAMDYDYDDYILNDDALADDDGGASSDNEDDDEVSLTGIMAGAEKDEEADSGEDSADGGGSADGSGGGGDDESQVSQVASSSYSGDDGGNDGSFAAPTAAPSTGVSIKYEIDITGEATSSANVAQLLDLSNNGGAATFGALLAVHLVAAGLDIPSDFAILDPGPGMHPEVLALASHLQEVDIVPVKTDAPTSAPTSEPTNAPTDSPSAAPSAVPTSEPTKAPTDAPTSSPTMTVGPTKQPSKAPSKAPSTWPTKATTFPPTSSPTALPTTSPTMSPTKATCSDGILNEDESDVDCGGVCHGCELGQEVGCVVCGVWCVVHASWARR
jgi:hypothetical protein